MDEYPFFQQGVLLRGMAELLFPALQILLICF